MGRAELIAIAKNYTDKKALSNVMNYAVAKKDKDRNKTGKVRFVGGLGVDYTDTEKAVRQMRIVKKYYGKTDKRQLYHYCTTFSDEVEDAQQVYVIGGLVAEKFFSGYRCFLLYMKIQSICMCTMLLIQSTVEPD